MLYLNLTSFSNVQCVTFIRNTENCFHNYILRVTLQNRKNNHMIEIQVNIVYDNDYNKSFDLTQILSESYHLSCLIFNLKDTLFKIQISKS